MTASSVTLNPGSLGPDIATDDITGISYQRVKLVDGTIDATTGIAAGGGTEAAALRVTVASDSTGVLSIDDNGGSLTIDGTVTANLSATDNAVLDSIDTSNAAIQTAVEILDNAIAGNEMQVDIVASLPAGTNNIGDVDVLSLVPGTGATNLGKAEDAAHTTGDVGVMGLFVRQDTQADFGADGDYVPGSVDANGALRVNAINADGTSNVDTAAGATDAGAVMLAQRDDALTTLTPIDGDYTTLRVNSTGALHVTGAGGGTQYSIDDAAPTVVTMAGAIRDDTLTTLTEADGDASVLRVSSTGALHVTGGGGGTEYTVNAAVPADPTGTASLMERDDALSALTEVEGDWTNQRANANGALWTAVDGTVTVDGSGVTQPVSGTVDLGATDNAVLDQIEVNTSYGDNTGGGTETGALRVTLANNSTGVLSVDDNGGSLTIDNADITTLAGAVTGTEMQVDVVAALPAGTNNIGDVDVATIAAGSALIGDVGISGARTSGGTTIFRSIDLDESEEQVTGSAGQIYWLHCMNMANAVRYLKIYNATAATVVVGTTTPVLTFPIPTQGDTNGAGFNLAVPNGIAFGTAITVAATTGIADNDTGAPGANEVILNLGYA